MAGRPPKDLDPGSSGRALFGSVLRMYRMNAGEPIAALAKKINYAQTTVGEVERGESRCDRDLAERCDAVYKTGGQLAHLWDHLVKDSIYRPWFVQWPGIEAKAVALRNYQLFLVPGLLQTEDYTRSLVYGNEDDVAARMKRQSVLTRESPPPPFMVFLLSESVLWNLVGDPKVMHDQLMHLVASVSERLSVQVVPNGVIHPGVTGSFVLATMPDRSEVSYQEASAQGIVSSTREHLEKLNESFEKIRSKSLPVDQSMDLIRRTAEEKWT